MTIVFIPYEHNRPAAVEINGHRLLILATSREEFEGELSTLGADEVRQIELVGDETEALAELAASVQSGVVVTPPGIAVGDMMQSLKSELPWVH